MSPDVSTLGGNQTHSATYEVPNVVLGNPQNRKVRVLSIGAGVSGILMAYRIQKDCQNVEHVIYDMNEDLGGTWLVNRYPGCACDVPSHAYTYNFALHPDWPRFFSHAPDIWTYLDKVCEVWGLRKHMIFNTEVIGCYWQEKAGEWLVKLRQKTASGECREFEDRCDILLHGTGILNNFKWPEIKGIEKFKGKLMHTARWPKEYQQDDWTKDRVAVIGSGASSIQTVPAMQPFVRHMDIFIRTGVWFVSIAGNTQQNKEYSQEEKNKFRNEPSEMVKHVKFIEDQVNGLWDFVFKGTEASAKLAKIFGDRMKSIIKDERLLKGFTPKWSVGCRRVTPGDPYMNAIQKPNVNVHFTPVVEITEDGVIGGDGIERKCDTIVCATGFDVSYRPVFPLVGKSGIDLAEKWQDHPESYLGLSIPDFPNLFTFIGPTWPVANGSVMGPLCLVGEYVTKAINKLQTENLHSFAPKQSVTDAYNEHVQKWMQKTVWTEECRSWYKDPKTGRINALWPGASLHYMATVQNPRWEDYEIIHKDSIEGVGAGNMWAWLGMGTTMGMISGDDVSPYFKVENIDPDWLAASGFQGDLEAEKERDRENLTNLLEDRRNGVTTSQPEQVEVGKKQSLPAGGGTV
ncbi:uncharacterized protein PV07_12521 [Cladophialophora immunda]|uniref:Sterigmatocystin biosynthesis monooxygenase stcW n=1 Tax=Cladophialophora immunda TaxID=569365 RepID=A0A0D2BUM6_9EURO|nr:uncharacterized protein PV07_12521 [Cladophialophora immunda]KIW22105.1 hypothetical protein PV07_12521 [Cladophialophora immunda]